MNWLTLPTKFRRTIRHGSELYPLPDFMRPKTLRAWRRTTSCTSRYREVGTTHSYSLPRKFTQSRKYIKTLYFFQEILRPIPHQPLHQAEVWWWGRKESKWQRCQTDIVTMWLRVPRAQLHVTLMRHGAPPVFTQLVLNWIFYNFGHLNT